MPSQETLISAVQRALYNQTPRRLNAIPLLPALLAYGVTLSNIAKYLESLGVASLRTCVMLDKPEGRVCDFHADYIGFTIPNKYVYGYGMDDEFGLLRGCPYIGAKEEE